MEDKAFKYKEEQSKRIHKSVKDQYVDDIKESTGIILDEISNLFDSTKRLIKEYTNK